MTTTEDLEKIAGVLGVMGYEAFVLENPPTIRFEKVIGEELIGVSYAFCQSESIEHSTMRVQALVAELARREYLHLMTKPQLPG